MCPLAGGRLYSELASRSITVSELKVSMVLDEDVKAKTGVRIAPQGQEVTFALLGRLRNFSEGTGIIEPIRVLAPL